MRDLNLCITYLVRYVYSGTHCQLFAQILGLPDPVLLNREASKLVRENSYKTNLLDFFSEDSSEYLAVKKSVQTNLSLAKALEDCLDFRRTINA